MGQQEKQPVQNDLRKTQSFTQVSSPLSIVHVSRKDNFVNFFFETYTGVTFLLFLNDARIKLKNKPFRAFCKTVSYNCIKSIYMKV